MCGIFGITGIHTHAGEVAHAGLCNLEYRGYDSWGVAERVGNGFVLHRDVGKISQSEYQSSGGGEAIGHSRWATHGRVTRENAHPHRAGKVILVHNGIIENHEALRAELVQQGYVFTSQTDSEVVAALVDSLMSEHGDMARVFQSIHETLKGRYAIVWMHEDTPGLFALREGSPLVVGLEDELSYLASDIPAFLDYTKRVQYLKNGEAARLDGAVRRYWNIASGKEIEKQEQEVEYKQESVSKGEYEHYMLKEIHDQAWSIPAALDQHDQDLSAVVQMMRSARDVYIIGCGTAHAMALWGQYIVQEYGGISARACIASEMVYHKTTIDVQTVVLVLSQSGETADTLEAVELAQSRGARVVALTNVVSSSLAQCADVVLPLSSGIEKSVASTKAASGMMAVLWRLATSTVRHASRAIRDVPKQLAEIDSALFQSLVETIAQHKHVFIIGRGVMYPIALEAAIKIAEVTYIHAQGFAAGELKHGPLALIEEGTPCIILGDDPDMCTSAAELQSRGAYVVGLSKNKQEVFDTWIHTYDTEIMPGLSTLITLQMLAYRTALVRGCDPDMPRNLAKSVTVK